jgi:chromosome segregation ATPase
LSIIFRAELAEAWRKNSKANETGDRQLYIELDELKAFKVSSEVKLAQSVMIEKQLREDIEQLQASKSLVDAKLTNSELSEKRLRTEIESLRSSASSSNQFVAQLDALTAYKMQLEDKVRKSEEKEALVRRSEEHLKAQLLQLVNRNADLQQRIELLESSTQEINLRDSRDGQLDTSLIAQLQNDIKEQDDIISALTVELKRSREAPKPGRDVQNIETTIRQEFEEELSSMRSQKEYFAQEVARLQNELQKNENDIILQLRAELQQIEESRSEHEKNMVTTFERKLSLMQMNKDLTIDSLRKDLSKFKAEAREMENNLLSKVSELEAEKLRLEERLATELQYKDSQIRHLEQNLAAHQQVSGHMKEELDQLQSGMESVSVNRRAEVEELQQDIINIQSKLKFYERENTSLKMRMEEQKGRYDEEIQKLNFQMFEQQSDSVKASSAGDSNHQRLYSEALVRMESLKNKLSSLQDENAKLREKIETLNDSQSKNDKWRNSALQEQVITLTQRLKEVEGDSGSVGSSSTYKSRKSRSSVLEDSFSGIDSDKYGDMDSAKAGSRVSTPSKGSMAMDSPSPALPPRTGSRSVDSEKFSDMESAKPSSRTSTPSRTPTADAPSPYPPRSTLRSNSQTRDRPWSRGD